MATKYIAFDIETAKEVPGADFNWRPYRPLGISCIASMSSSCKEPHVWYTKDANDKPMRQMSCDDVSTFIHYLESFIGDGFVPLTWNGLSFDYDILAEESNLRDKCKEQTMGHVDMMFHVVCDKGFPVGLANAAAGMGVRGKLRGVDGCNVPTMWLHGQHEAVCEYVAQDVRTTLELGMECEKRRVFKWRTGSGKISTMPLPKGWLTVNEAMRLPLPDTSWMSNPVSRNHYIAWLKPT